MGALYIAVTGDRGLERLLVIKTVLPHLADKEYVARFRDEAKVVVQLSHQNLIQVFDAGQVDGELFLAMDLIEGKDLRAVWNRCAKKAVAFPLDIAVFVVKELCRGLGYAHSQGDLGVVHRDVSPPNVIVSYNGEVKLTDFGLAASTLKLEKTAPGIVYGKVSYMSPEQARGEALDGRSDLYAAGIILWELLTGRQLFPAGADQGQDLLDRSANPVVPTPSSRAPRVPAELDAICAKALAADPRDRYSNGEAFREALATWLAAHNPTTDAARLERFLGQLFTEDMDAERAHRAELLATTRERVSTLPPSHELHKLFAQLASDDADRRSGEGPNLGRRAIDDGDADSDRRRVSGRRAVDKLAEGVGTILGMQASAPVVGSAAVAVAEAEVLLTNPKTAADVDSVIGSVLDGRYRIDELLGEGGMGRVYLGEHVEIGRTVAIKILHAVYSGMPDLVERFRREARAATKIGHPNIVDVTDSGVTGDGSAYFVMEYLDGIELGSVIDKEGALEVGRSLGIATQICRALAAAHAVDIIHRDLKPENVFLTTKQGVSDFAKVLDFGIAKSGEAEKARERKLTSPGVAMGTPEYMAPEQAAGKPADERCDIYAVGAILYEMLSGLPPYEGANFMEILSKKATSDPPPLLSIRSDVPEEVAALVSQAMAREPDDRPSSMEALEYELTKLSSGRGVAVANAIGLSSDVSTGSEVPRTNPPGFSSNPVESQPTGPTVSERPPAADVADADDDDETNVVSAETTEPTTVDTSSAAMAATVAVPTTAPLPFDNEVTGFAQERESRSSRAGWYALFAVVAIFAVGLAYVILKERGGHDPAGISANGAASVGPSKPGDGTSGAKASDVAGTRAGSRAAFAADAGAMGTTDGEDGKNPSSAKTDGKKDDGKKDDGKKDDGKKGDGKKDDGKKGDGKKDDGKKDDAKKDKRKPAELFKRADAALASGKSKHPIARDLYRAALAAGGSKSKGNFGLARVAFENNKYKEAIKYAKRAGLGARTLQLLGDSYFKLGDCANALDYYKRWLEKQPTSKNAKSAVKRCSH